MAKGLELTDMSDSELAGLMDEMRQESARRNKAPSAPSFLLRSRYIVALMLLGVVFFVLFKSETNGVGGDVAQETEKVLAKPGEKGAWMVESDPKKDQVANESKDLKANEESKKEKENDHKESEASQEVVADVQDNNEKAIPDATIAPHVEETKGTDVKDTKEAIPDTPHVEETKGTGVKDTKKEAVPDATDAPVEETKGSVVKATNKEAIPIPDATVAPVEETKGTDVKDTKKEAPDATDAPVEETKGTVVKATNKEAIPDATVAPVEETKGTDVKDTEKEPTPATTVAPVEETKGTVVKVTNKEAIPDATVAPVEETKGTEVKETEKETVPVTTVAPRVEETKKAPVSAVASTPASLANFPVDKADDATKKAALAAGTHPKVRYQYKRRSPLEDPKKKAELAKRWGSWTLVDPKANQRPTDDFAKGFPHRDIPWDKFPSNAWQIDQDYLAKFLPEAKNLVERALEAMLGEYGWSKYDLPKLDFETRMNGGSFKVAVLDPKNETEAKAVPNRKSFMGDTLSGWYSPDYFQGLKRRLMHALITEDTFTLVMGGHSASAGHGNHFQQSYTLQFFKVMEPIFARLGVKLRATNNGYGGLGTWQSALAGGDLYGREIDILVWDSQMTENSAPNYDLFARQVLLSGNRIPVLMGGMRDALTKMAVDIDAEVGMFGHGQDGVPEVTDAKQAESIIWAARYLRCTSEMHGHCREKEYNGTCWIDRDDYTPEKKQNAEPGGRAGWHPGFKQHAIKGRILAFPVLRALLEGLKEWDEASNKKLPEEKWHVTALYENLRTKMKNQKEAKYEEPGGSLCYNNDVLKPKSWCNTPFQGVGEMTPRAYPRETAIRNIMKPAYNGYLPIPKKNVYNPPDVFNPTLHVPDGEFDYLAVVENGIDYAEFLAFDYSPLPAGYLKNKLVPLGIAAIKPGLGWFADSNANPDECDGSFDGFCGRDDNNVCLLYGHNDHRGGLGFDSYSGWGVFTVPNVKNGVIAARLEWWHLGSENPITVDWESENNGDAAYKRRLSVTKVNSTRTNSTPYMQRNRNFNSSFESSAQRKRMLGGPELCADLIFEFAVGGSITKYTKQQFIDNLLVFQRVVQVLIISDNPKLTGGKPSDVEIAMRMTGCAHANAMYLSNIYWS